MDANITTIFIDVVSSSANESETVLSTNVTLNDTSTDNDAWTYTCTAGDTTCPETCFSLYDCEQCDCVITQLEDTGGPWGEVMDLIFCLLPIIYLVVSTIKSNPTPTTVSLPVSAMIMMLVRLMYLASHPVLTMGCLILGFFEAITPLSIMAGAITLFETMEATQCLPYMMREMKALTDGHPVAECMLLFAFATLVEGASGFGTPVALGAPMLVSTGHPPLESVVLMLLFNTFATVWGAVGTPLWFGFGDLGLSEDDLTEISLKSAIAMIFGAFLLIPFILTILVPFSIVKSNIIFLLLSIGCVMGPMLGIASFNYEFPSLIGGLLGFGLIAILIKFKIGLHKVDKEALEEFQKSKSAGMQASVSGSAAAGEGGGQGKAATSKTGLVLHRAISDLTELVVIVDDQNNTNNYSATITDSQKLEPPIVEEKAMTSPQEDSNDNLSHKNDELALKSSTNSLSNGHWDNIEITDEATKGDDASNTVVVLSDEKNVVIAEGGDEEDVKEKAESMIASAIDKVEGQASIKSGRVVVDDAYPNLGPRKSWKEGFLQETIMRTFPIWATVLLLLLTRISQIGIKEYLTKLEPAWEVQFGTFALFRLSVSVVFQLRNILTYPGLNYKYELLYIPFLIPFVVVSLCTMLIYRKGMTSSPKAIAATVTGRLKNPAIAVTGALMLVQLMIRFGTESPAFIIGSILADWLRQGFVVLAPLLGALGSFFSGSTTVSNLTFGEIQQIAADTIGISETSMLALQAVGASAGNGICLNNIIAALAVVGLNVSEGQILKRTAKYVLANTTIATVVMLAIFIRF